MAEVQRCRVVSRRGAGGDKGRVVFLGEAAMCTAQVSGAEKNPMGMNHPGANQNAQFCLNVVHWLDGVLE